MSASLVGSEMCIRDSTSTVELVSRREVTVSEAADFGPLFCPGGPLITFDGSSRRVDGEVVAGGAVVV
eukprot:14702797-Alexandrium_andersonii.AAC.1